MGTPGCCSRCSTSCSSERLADTAFLSEHTEGWERLADLVQGHAPEATVVQTGIEPDRVRQLARDFAAAESAAAYGRTGSCLGRFGTLVAFLLDALNAATGNLDRPGGSVFGDPPIKLDRLGEQLGLATYGETRSRFGGFPDVLGNLPASLLPKEIETAGERQIRALFVSAGNPVLSVPDGDSLERALGKLDLMVALDLYVNETNRHADYVLPAATMYEREDLPVALLSFFSTPFVQATEAVVEPAGEAREEWRVIDDLARRIGKAPYSVKAVRLIARLGLRPTPRQMMDLLLRIGPTGDRFGLRRSGLNMRKLIERHPHGLVLADHLKTGILASKLRTRSKRVRLAPEAVVGEVDRANATAEVPDTGFPLRLIGMRELRSHNSWMHNSPLLMRGERVHALRVHPDDADAHGLEDGGGVRIESKAGAVEVPVVVTDEMTPGAVALPHGWGHRGGWRLANASGGANVNVLASGAPEDLEPLAGMAFLNGIPVRVTAVSPRSSDAPAAIAAPSP